MLKPTSQKRELLARTLKKAFLGVFAVVLVLGVWLSVDTSQTSAATSNTINFQARLETNTGAIAPDGNYNIEFNLYSVSSGGTSLWTEDYLNSSSQGVHVSNGYITVNLGSITAFPNTINWDRQLWLGMTVRGTGSCSFSACTPTDAEMSPRLQLTAVPYALSAGQLQTTNATTGHTSTLQVLQPGSGVTGNEVFQIADQGATGTYNLCIQNSSACGFASASGSGSYIQNGTSLQAGANFNIDGTGIVNTLQATTIIGGNATSCASSTNSIVASSGFTTCNISGNAGVKLTSDGSGGIMLLDINNNLSNGNFRFRNSSNSDVFQIKEDGTAIASVALQAPAVDTASVGTLTIGGTNATTVNVGKSGSTINLQSTTNVSGLLTMNGGAVVANGQTLKVGTLGTSTGQLYVSGSIPSAAMGSVTTGTHPASVSLQGHYAYVVNAGSATLQVFDASNPAAPVSVGSVATGTTPIAVSTQGHYAYVANQGSNTLQIFDISNPAAPVSVGSVATDTLPESVYVQGRYAYVVNGTSNTLQIFDISNPAVPVLAGSAATGSGPESVFVSGHYAYVVNQTANTLQTFDVSNPRSPTSASSISTGASSTPFSIYVQGRYAYVADYGTSLLQVYDVKNPAALTASIGSVATGTNPDAIYVQGRYAYVASWTGNTLQTFDVSTPTAPTLAGSVTTGTQADWLYVSGRYAYVVNYGSNSLQTFDIGGAYIQQLEAGGAEVGTLQVNSNASFSGDASIQGGLNIGQSLQVAANASINGQLAVNAGIAIGAGSNFVNGGSTLNSSKALSLGSSGAIGTAAATVDAYTTFDITATAGSLSFTLPNPTVTTSGRIVYINNVGATNSFVVNGATLGTGTSANFIWNGSAWAATAVSTGVSLVGAYSTTNTAANGATISGNSIIFQSASTSAPGMVDTGSQTFAGAKTFNAAVTLQGGATVADGQTLKVGTLGTSTGQLYVSGAAPTYVGQNSDAGLAAPSFVAVAGHYAYVASKSNGALVIYDVSNPANPVEVSSSTAGLSQPVSVAIAGRYAYIANNGNNALVVYDISNPYSPAELGSTTSGLSVPSFVTVSGRYAYVTSQTNAYLVVFDVSNPASPTEVGSTNSLLSAPVSVAVTGHYAYVADKNNSTVLVFNVSNPASPTFVTNLSGLSTPVYVTTSGNYLYVADFTKGLVIFNLNNPASPVLSGSSTTGLNTAFAVTVAGRYAYVASNGNNSIVTFNVSNPASPTEISSSNSNLTQPEAVAVSGRYAYVASWGSNKLVDFDLGGTYSQQLEAGSTETGTLMVDNAAQFASDASIQGALTVGQSLQVGGSVGVDGSLLLQNAVASAVATVIRGAAGGQTGDFLQLQDSNGNVLSKIDNLGDGYFGGATSSIRLGSFGDTSNTFIQAAGSATNLTLSLQAKGNGATYIKNGSGSVLATFGMDGTTTLNSESATAIPLVVKGYAGQTSELLQLQDANADILTKFDANGQLTSYGTNTNLLGLSTPAAPTVSSTGTSYYYAVAAYNSQGRTLPSTGIGASTDTVTVTWSQVSGATGYYVYRSATNNFASGQSVLLVATISNGSTTSWTDSAVAGSSYTVAKPAGTILTLQGWQSQTSNMLDVQDSSGANQIVIDSSGRLHAGGVQEIANEAAINTTSLNITSSTGGSGGFGGSANANLFVQSGNSQNAITVKISGNTPNSFNGVEVRTNDNHVLFGAGSNKANLYLQNYSGQTEDLLRLQDANANVLTKFDTNGQLTSYGTNTNLLGLATPVITSVTNTGTAGTTTYGYRVSAVNAQGETVASTEVTTTTGNATLSSTNYNTVNWNSVPGATSYKVYGRTAGSELYMATVTATGASTYSYNDQGTVTPSGALPGNPAGTTLTLQGWGSQTGDALQVQNSSGAAVAGFGASGYLGIGGDAQGWALAVTQGGTASGWIASLLQPNLTANGYNQIVFGQAGSNNNSGVLTYTNNSTTPANSYLSLGLYGNSSALNVTGSGNVGIGITNPQATFNVNVGGTASSDTLLIGNNNTKGLELRDTGGAVDIASDGVALYINNNNQAVYLPGASGVAIGGTAVLPNTQFDVYAKGSSVIGEVIQGVSGQSADLLELQNNNSQVLDKFNSNGDLQIGGVNSASSTTAFQVQGSSGTALLSADTTNMRVSIGSLGTATGQLYVGGKVPVDISSGGVSTGTSSSPESVAISGHYAYVVDYGTSKLQVFDVSNPASPTDVTAGGVATGANPYAVAISGHYAYVVNGGANTLQVFDVSNPASPTSVTSVSTQSLPIALTISGRYAYVVDHSASKLQVFDVSNPASPTDVTAGGIATGGGPQSIAVSGHYAYVVNNNTGINTLQVFDVSKPASPTSVTSVATGVYPDSVAISGRYAFVANFNTNTLQVFDVSNPASPTSVASVATGTGPYALTVSGRYVYVSNYNAKTLQVFDVSNPASPTDVSAGGATTSAGPHGLTVSGRYAYVVDYGASTLQVFDLGGAYIQQLQAGDSELTNLQVDGGTILAGNASIQGGLSVGQSLQVTGDVGMSGSFLLQTTNNSVTAFQIQNSSGKSVLAVDTQNGTITIMSPTSSPSTLVVKDGSSNTVLLVDTSNKRLGVNTATPGVALSVNGGNNINLNYPDGLVGTPITQSVTNTTTYTVPAGDTLYITYALTTGGTSSGYLSINNMPLYRTMTASGQYFLMGMPIVVAAGSVISDTITNAVYFNGILVPSGVSPITQSVTNTTTYTVPAGKTLYIGIARTSGNYLQINGNNIYSDIGASSAAPPILIQPIIVGPGSVVSCSSSTTLYFNGYLANSNGLGGP